MNKLNKKYILPGFMVTLFLVAALYGANQVFAEDFNKYPLIVSRVASRFSLKESDVNEVFEQQKAEMWQNRKIEFSNRLDQAVKDGKITEDQKQKILAKKDEIEANREAEMKQNKSDLQNWMKENGIDADILMPYLEYGGFGGKHHFNHMKMMN